ncbi:HAD superfamily hydrolase [Actinobacillus pleuropneumoniae]|nr:HAD superfamily hydrolase [Actinobacillus pleuropneumoniae]
MGEAEQIQSLEKLLKQQLPHLAIHRSKNEYLEIMNKQATKSNAIRFMETILNVNQDQVIAFGDNLTIWICCNMRGLAWQWAMRRKRLKRRQNGLPYPITMTGLQSY